MFPMPFPIFLGLLKMWDVGGDAFDSMEDVELWSLPISH
jgi:hypothetical protein